MECNCIHENTCKFIELIKNFVTFTFNANFGNEKYTKEEKIAYQNFVKHCQYRVEK